ncbi:MAG: hypothetical protein ACRD82_03690, partial [Blastocatellia bacterium]
MAILLLSPLALLCGAWLVLKYDGAAQAGMGIDRNQAIIIAAEAARSKGLDLTNWSSLCWTKAENDLHYYQQLPSTPEREMARKVSPALQVAVLFRSPDRSENIEVDLAVDGRVIAYNHKSPKTEDTKDQGEPAARKIAEEALQRRLAAVGLPFSGELQLGAPPARTGQQPPP